MAKPQRVTFFKVSLEDRPGALLGVARHLKSKNVGLVGLSGRDKQPGQAEALLIPKNPDKLRDALRSYGSLFEEGTGFFIKGTDKTGALVTTLEALAKAEVNILMSEALAVSGKYAFFFQVAPEDVEKTATALGAK